MNWGLHVSHQLGGTKIQGTTSRKDTTFIKMTLYNLCKWTGLPVETEVYNIFSRLIPQQGLARGTGNVSRLILTYG